MGFGYRVPEPLRRGTVRKYASAHAYTVVSSVPMHERVLSQGLGGAGY